MWVTEKRFADHADFNTRVIILKTSTERKAEKVSATVVPCHYLDSEKFKHIPFTLSAFFILNFEPISLICAIEIETNCWHEIKTCSLTKIGLNGGSSFRFTTSFQQICLKNMCFLIASPFSGPEPSLWLTCLYVKQKKKKKKIKIRETNGEKKKREKNRKHIERLIQIIHDSFSQYTSAYDIPQPYTSTKLFHIFTQKFVQTQRKILFYGKNARNII